MSLVLKDRVRETTTTIGTGAIALDGTLPGFQSFAEVGDGNQTFYVVEHPAEGDWEVGLGTYSASGNTLSRDEVYDSSNGGALVDFAAGEKRVFVSYPAGQAVSKQEGAAGLPYDNTIKQRLESTDAQSAIDEMVDFFTATIIGSNATSDWSQATSSDPWIATLTINGILSTDRPIVSLDVSAETLEDALFLQKVWNLLYRVEASADDEVKFYAIGEPFPDLNIIIKVIR